MFLKYETKRQESKNGTYGVLEGVYEVLADRNSVGMADAHWNSEDLTPLGTKL
jgi:hypothetical protein